MYQKFFQFSRRAFSATPDSALLYATSGVNQAIDALEQVLRQGEGIGLLTAPAGIGKTLVCNVLQDRLSCHCSTCGQADSAIDEIQEALGVAPTVGGPVPVLLLHAQFPTRRSLLQAMLFELDRPYAQMTEQELRLSLISYGRELAEKHQGVAVIVDEAHLLGGHILEELRGLTNYTFSATPVFRVVLSGQLELEEILTSRSLEAVNQRLECHVTLETLTKQQSIEYIESRIQSCGTIASNVFTADAIDLIVHASDGLPRCINQLCDHVCLLASLSGEKPADESVVRDALEDLMKLPLHWNIPTQRLDPVSEINGSEDDQNMVEQAAGDVIEDQFELYQEFGSDSASESTFEIESSENLLEKTESVEENVFETSAPEALSSETSVVETEGSANVIEVGNGLELAFDSPSPQSSLDEETISNEVEDGFDKVAFDLEKIEAGEENQAQTQTREISFDNDFSDSIEGVADVVDEILEEESVTETEVIAAEVEAEVDELVLETEATETEAIEPEAVEVEADLENESKLQQLLEEAETQTEQSECEGESWEEEVHDRYAVLDARRLGQLSDVASIESKYSEASRETPSLTGEKNVSTLPDESEDLLDEELEQQIGQSVLELTTELAAAIGGAQGDIVPNPDDIIVTASESLPEDDPDADTEYDVVDPE